MTLGPTILLAPLLLEDANLLALVELADNAEHLGAGHERSTRRHVAIVVADEQHLSKDTSPPASPELWPSTAMMAPGSTRNWRPEA